MSKFKGNRNIILGIVCITIIVIATVSQILLDPLSEDTTPDITLPPSASYNEAPQLAALVASGQLPPVEDRLPTNPLVIQPVDQVGVYGGTWRMGNVGSKPSFLRTYFGYENLLRWDPTWSRIIPNIAQSYSVNEDASEYTFPSS